MNSFVAKLLLVLVWPVFAAFLAALILATLVLCWVAIPFGTFVRKEDGSWTMKMGGVEKE